MVIAGASSFSASSLCAVCYQSSYQSQVPERYQSPTGEPTVRSPSTSPSTCARAVGGRKPGPIAKFPLMGRVSVGCFRAITHVEISTVRTRLFVFTFRPSQSQSFNLNVRHSIFNSESPQTDSRFHAVTHNFHALDHGTHWKT